MKLTVTLDNKVIAAVAFVGVAFVAGHVAATEFPEPDSELSYSGLLTDSAGNPRTSTDDVLVQLYAVESGGSALCSATATNVNLASSQGRFRVPLQAACADATRDHGDVWAQVKVGATTLPRQKLGAAPYAVSARDAQRADVALTVADLEVDGIRYAPSAVYRATTTTTHTGLIAATGPQGPVGGYRAAKALCETRLGSPSAHMCTVDEMVRSAQLGLQPDVFGWIASGGRSYIPLAAGAVRDMSDCAGYVTTSTSEGGAAWLSYQTTPSCDVEYPIHCCDS